MLRLINKIFVWWKKELTKAMSTADLDFFRNVTHCDTQYWWPLHILYVENKRDQSVSEKHSWSIRHEPILLRGKSVSWRFTNMIEKRGFSTSNNSASRQCKKNWSRRLTLRNQILRLRCCINNSHRVLQNRCRKNVHYAKHYTLHFLGIKVNSQLLLKLKKAQAYCQTYRKGKTTQKFQIRIKDYLLSDILWLYLQSCCYIVSTCSAWSKIYSAS